MPTVPSNFVPQADMQGGGEVPLQAPGVEPVRNLAADQQVQLGEAMTRAGNVAWNVGSNIQDKIDEAGAKAADVQNLNSIQQILIGQNGYLLKEGKNAIDNFQPAHEAMAQSANSIIDGLPNETQKSMAKYAMARNMLSAQGQMLDHKNKQARVYSLNEADARVAQVAYLAGKSVYKSELTDENGHPVGEYNENIGIMAAENADIIQQLQLPPNSYQALQIKQKSMGKVATAAVSTFTKDGNFVGAKNWLKKQEDNQLLDESTGLSLGDFVDKNQKRQGAIEAARSYIDHGYGKSYAMFGYSPIVDALSSRIVEVPKGTANEDNGVTYKVAPNAEIKSPQDSVVELTETTKGKNAITLRMKDGTKAIIDGVGELFVYKGQSINSGMKIATAGTSDIHYSMQRNDQYINPTQANFFNTMTDITNAKPAVSLRDALNMANEIHNPDLREMIRSNIKSMWDENMSLQHSETANLELKFYQWAAKNPGKTVEQTPPEFQLAIHEMNPKFLDEFNDSIKKKTSEATLLDYALHPEKYNTQELILASDLNPQEKVKAVENLRSLDASNIALDQKQMEQTLFSAGQDKVANPTGTEEEKLPYIKQGLLFVQEVKTRIASKQQALGRKLTQPEKQKEMDEALMVSIPATMGGGFWSIGIQRGSPKVSIFMTPEERKTTILGNAPQADIDALLEGFRKTGIPNPTTEQMIAKYQSILDLENKKNKK